MGTFSDSSYKEARKSHVCADCGRSIIRYETYLSYALAQRNRVSICLECSASTDDDGFKWNCQVVAARVEQLCREDALYRSSQSDRRTDGG